MMFLMMHRKSAFAQIFSLSFLARVDTEGLVPDIPSFYLLFHSANNKKSALHQHNIKNKDA